MNYKKQYLLYSFILFLILNLTISAQSIVNVNYKVSGEKIIINYMIDGDIDSLYKITVNLRRESNDNYLYKPINLKGDIGIGKYGGTKRTIIWPLTLAESKKLIYNDYYIEILADKINGNIDLAETHNISTEILYFFTGIAVIAIVAITSNFK